MDYVWNTLDRINNSRVGKWVNRNRKRIIVTIVIGGSTYLVYKVVQLKLSQYTEQSAQSLHAKGKTLETLKMQQYFNHSQKRCDVMLLKEIIPDLQDRLIEFIPVPTKEELRKSLKGPNELKMSLWGQAKTHSFTRSISAIYASCLMTLFLRVEVNILARYLYMDSSVQTEREDENPIPIEVQQQYLSFSNSGHIREKGLEKLIQFVNHHVVQELNAWPLTRKCSFEDVVALLGNIRNRIERDARPLDNSSSNNGSQQPSKYCEFVVQHTIMPNLQLQVLMNETRDVLESKQFDSILKSCVDLGFSFLLNNLREAFTAKPIDSTDSINISQESKKNESTMLNNHTEQTLLPLAKISPLVKKETKKLLNSQDATESTTFLKTLFQLKELEEYSYYVFTSSYDQE